MTVAPVYKQGWTMDDIHWSLFDREKVEPNLLAAIKAAALVEYNAPGYVTYLKRVFAGSTSTIAALEQWGREESQHGRALGRWAEMADPTFKLGVYFFERDEPLARKYWEKAQALAPDNWNYHRQDWIGTEGLAGPKFRAKRSALGDKPYYAPLDIPKPGEPTPPR